MSELNDAIKDRKSYTSGMDLISPLLLRDLPTCGMITFLNIINNFFLDEFVPETQNQFKVISITESSTIPKAYLRRYAKLQIISLNLGLIGGENIVLSLLTGCLIFVRG